MPTDTGKHCRQRSAVISYRMPTDDCLKSRSVASCPMPKSLVIPLMLILTRRRHGPRIPNGEVFFACVGRLHPPSKGQDILLESLATRVWANRKWRLTLYGDGPMKGSLERLVQHLELTDRVFFAGHEAVKDIWSSNQVLVMPSRSEGLPLVLVEAMLCGRPVIATDVAGHSEVIVDGDTGFLAEAPTVRSMSKALERFWARRTEIEQMGGMARERIRQLVPPNPVEVFADKIKKIVVVP